ncbi:MAG: DPP IV N-terminal domain-containing protein [Planctomycetes bacterium]|nr:DPP IV N-terminal domain-containing protein [Planctomycetota bacterium]
MRRTLLTALVLAGLLSIAGAQKQEMTLQQAVMQPFAFTPRGPQALGWHPTSARVTMIARGAKGPALMAIDATDGSRADLVTAQDFEAAAKSAGIEGLDLRALLEARFLDDGKTLRFGHDGRVYRYDCEAKQIHGGIGFAADSEAQAFAKDDEYAAWSKDKDVWVGKPDGTTVRVTRGGHEFLTHGLSVSRVEFGITDGLWWSPDGRRLAFYREDLRPIRPYPYINWEPRPAEHKLGRYPMAGQAGSIVSVGVYDSRDDSVIWLATDPNVDEYLTNITWDPTGEKVFVAHVNREQNRCELKSYSAADGKLLASLLVETDKEWTEPEHGPIFLPDGSGDFLWFSPRDGYNHLYLYKADGHLMQQVTRGAFDVSAFSGFSKDGASIYVAATGEKPIEMHLYRAQLAPTAFRVDFGKGGSGELFRSESPMTQLTSGRGQHEATVSPCGNFLLDSRSDLETPLVVDIVDLKSGERRTIHESPNPWDRVRGGREELFTVKAEDGSDLHGHIILPPDLDEGKKYPVLLYVYGGPHSQLVKDEFLGGSSFSGPWFHYMACQGVIVIRLDGHGTLNRGIDFQQAVHRRLGTLEVKDQIAGLEYLLSRPYVDRNRVGVHGWSYGGFMTLSLMTRAGEYFKCGISGAPVTDWAYYETGYGERYMDRPQENEDGYKTAMPASHLDGLRGRLLVVQGSSDETVVWQHTIDFIDRCVKADKPVEYMVYPGQLHGLRGPYRWHFHQKMTKFFLDELKAD